jgi:predicted Zn-dependent protease
VKLAATTTALISYSRAQEAEADYLGVQYSYAAGYDPGGAVSIFEKLNRVHPDNLLDLVLGEHPLFTSRIEKTQKEIQTVLAPKPDYLVTTSEYREVRECVISLEDRPESLKRTAAKDSNPPPKVQRKDAVE